MGAVTPAYAQAGYPSKPIRFIVPFAPGGESDIVARHLANTLTKLKGYPVIVENVPGAGGSLGVEKGLREAPDGYTFIVISGAFAANAVASGKKEDPLVTIQPVIQFGSQPSVLIANKKHTGLAELLDKARKAPGALNYGTAGIASLGHFSNEAFSQAARVKLTHIPYKGSGPAVNDLVSGQIDMMFAGVSAAQAAVSTGNVRILAVTTTNRVPELPGIPTLMENGVPYVGSLWHGLIAAKGVPAPIITKMNADMNTVLRDPETITSLKLLMLTPAGGSPREFGQVIAGELERLKQIAAVGDIRNP